MFFTFYLWLLFVKTGWDTSGHLELRSLFFFFLWLHALFPQWMDKVVIVRHLHRVLRTGPGTFKTINTSRPQHLTSPGCPGQTKPALTKKKMASTALIKSDVSQVKRSQMLQHRGGFCGSELNKQTEFFQKPSKERSLLCSDTSEHVVHLTHNVYLQIIYPINRQCQSIICKHMEKSRGCMTLSGSLTFQILSAGLDLSSAVVKCLSGECNKLLLACGGKEEPFTPVSIMTVEPGKAF